MLVCLGIKNKHFIIPGHFSSLLYILEELAVCVCVCTQFPVDQFLFRFAQNVYSKQIFLTQ